MINVAEIGENAIEPSLTKHPIDLAKEASNVESIFGSASIQNGKRSLQARYCVNLAIGVSRFVLQEAIFAVEPINP